MTHAWLKKKETFDKYSKLPLKTRRHLSVAAVKASHAYGIKPEKWETAMYKDASKYPPFDEVLAELRRVRESTTALLDSLSEDDLDKASAMVPEGLENTFGTYRHCLQFAADHWYMHRGQLADARRAAGLDRAGF